MRTLSIRLRVIWFGEARLPVRPPAEKSPGRTASHRGTPYRCFLPDLTRFGAPAAQDPGSSQRAVKRDGIVIRTGLEPRGWGRTSTRWSARGAARARTEKYAFSEAATL